MPVYKERSRPWGISSGSPACALLFRERLLAGHHVCFLNRFLQMAGMELHTVLLFCHAADRQCRGTSVLEVRKGGNRCGLLPVVRPGACGRDFLHTGNHVRRRLRRRLRWLRNTGQIKLWPTCICSHDANRSVRSRQGLSVLDCQ